MGTKQHLAEQTADQLTLQRALGGATIARETAILLDAKISEYVAKGKLYEQEKIAIKAKADGLQKEYDALNAATAFSRLPRNNKPKTNRLCRSTRTKNGETFNRSGRQAPRRVT